MSELVMRDRKASRLAGAWLAAGVGDSAALAQVVDQAVLEVSSDVADPDVVAARRVLYDVENVAAAIGKCRINPASATTWALVVRKLRAQELVS